MVFPKAHSAFLKSVIWFFVLCAVAGVFLPVFLRPVTKNTGISCMSNLEQMGLAFVQYAQDNDDKMPNIAAPPADKNTWRVAIFPYVKNKTVFQCPTRDDKTLGTDGLARSYAANYSGNYGTTQPDKGNGALAGVGSKPLSLIGFQAPADLIMACETDGSDRPEFNIDDAKRFGPTQSILWAGHNGGGNFVFADGHVKWMRPAFTYQTDRAGTVRLNRWYRDSRKPLSANGVAVLRAAEAKGKQ